MSFFRDLVHKVCQELLCKVCIARLSHRLHGVLVHLVCLGNVHRLSPPLVLLVNEGRNASKLHQLVFFNGDGESDVIKVVVGVDRLAEAFIVLLLDAQVVDGFVDALRTGETTSHK